jgi:hypothetical protein
MARALRSPIFGAHGGDGNSRGKQVWRVLTVLKEG